MDEHLSALEHFRQGRRDMERGELERALAHLRSAHDLDPGCASYRSHYGLVLGIAERHWDEAVSLCRSAARQEFFEPAHYLNLAQLHLAFGFKAEAVRQLNRGLMIAPGHEGISAALMALGVRRRPPLVFLRRENAINRLIGRLMGRISMRPEPDSRAGASA